MKKYVLVLFIFIFILMAFNAKSVSAEDLGCAGGSTYSSTTGALCDTTPIQSGSGGALVGTPIPQETNTNLPDGCISNSGFSSTTGASCNISTVVPDPTKPYLDGCTSYAGFSSTTGSPCDGSAKPIYPYEPECLSSQGYSTTTGLCNTFVRLNPTIIPGCTSTLGVSSTTGVSCDSTPSYPSGCYSYAGFSSTTGLACDGSTTPSITPVVNSSGTGYVSTIPAATNISNTNASITSSPNTDTILPSQTSTPPPTCTVSSTLRIGSKGDDVACLQSLIGLVSDGKFGLRTQIAVKAFQANAGLKADGVVGPKSIAALEVEN
jgi:hypothetical protein